MTRTQLKLKEYFDELLNETDYTAKHGDHSSHSGYFNSESGCGEPPYTGDGLAAEEELKEWEEFMTNPLAMFDWECLLDMPEMAQQAFEKWLDIHLETMTQFRKERGFVQVALIEKFARDFFEVATGKSFEVVSL